jgi:hypothetical protein
MPDDEQREQNQNRAETAERTIEFFRTITEAQDEPIEDHLTDLLNNLMHLADYNATLSFEDCLRRAEQHFAEETMDTE